MGMGIKSISSAFHVSRNTVRKYVRRYQESGLTLEQLLSMSEAKVQDMFLDECNRSRKAYPRMEELRVTGTGTIDPPVPLTVLHAVYG